MSAWIMANLGTMVVSLVLLGIVAAITASLAKNKHRGRSSCGGNCGCCGGSCSCHGETAHDLH